MVSWDFVVDMAWTSLTVPGRLTHCICICFGLLTNILVTAMLLTEGSAIVISLTGIYYLLSVASRCCFILIFRGCNLYY